MAKVDPLRINTYLFIPRKLVGQIKDKSFTVAFVRDVLKEYEFIRHLKLYHGTSSSKYDEIMASGLDDPYLTDSPDKAEYYATEDVEDTEKIHGGEGVPIVLLVDIHDTSRLRVDFNEIDEPVTAGTDMSREEIEEAIQKEYKRYLEKHPESYDKKYGVINVNPKHYQVSLNTVRSVRYEGTIPPFDMTTDW